MAATIEPLLHVVGTYLLVLAWALPIQSRPDLTQLEARLEMTTGFERLQVLHQLTQTTLVNAPREAIEYATEALALAEDLDDGQGRVEALSKLGTAHYFLGEYHSALQFYEARLALCEQLNDDEAVANALNDIGIIYYAWGEHDRALDYYTRALEIWRRTNNRNGLAIGNNNLANVYHTAKRYEEALEHLDRALELYSELGDESRVASVLNNIALGYQELGRLDEALESLEQAFEIQQRLEDKPGIAMSLNNIGMVYDARGQDREALDYYQQSLGVREEIGDRQGIAVCISNIGWNYAELGELDLALSHLNDALASIQEMGVKEIERDIQLKLTKAYELKGDHESALASLRQHDSIDSDLSDESTARSLAELEARFQLEQKDREIEVLRKEQELQRTVRNAVIGGAVLLLALVLLLYNRYRLKDRANRALEEAQAAREETVRTELSHVSMGELGTALAHELNQPLTAILANAQATRRLLASGRADPAELDEALADIVDGSGRARELIQRQRKLLQRGELVRETLDINETLRAVEPFARADVRRDGATLALRLAPDLPPISGDRIQLQQVLLNLVHNAAEAMSGREPGLREVEVRTELEGDDGVRVAVSDSGPPLDAEVIERIFHPFFTTKSDGLGMGLSICHTIIDAHAGRLWAEPRNGSGLTVQFTLPGRPAGN